MHLHGDNSSRSYRKKKFHGEEKTHSAAVKIWLELVQMAFMGLSCPFISPMGAKVSTFQSLRVPPLQPLSRTGTPGTRPRAHTQSLWAFGTCWKREGRPSLTGLHETLGMSAEMERSHVLSLIPALQCICYMTQCIPALQLLLLERKECAGFHEAASTAWGCFSL